MEVYFVNYFRGGPSGRYALIAHGLMFWLLGSAIFFRDTWRTGFDVVMGDLGDTRLIVFLHEHLYDWLRGVGELRSPPAYFPQQGTLGFSDAFLLDALPYALFRTLGADPYLAMLMLQVALSLLCFGCAAMVYLKYLRIRPLFAFAAAMLATFPNNLFFKAGVGHINILGLYYLPLLVLLALWAFEGFPRLTQRALWRGAAAGLLFALLFGTAYYVAWMFALTLLIAGLCIGARYVIGGGRIRIERAALRPLARLLLAMAAGFAVGLVPFVHIYGPVLATAPVRSFATYLALAPTPLGMLNVSGANWLWGWLVDALFGVPASYDVERSLAVTPALTVIFLWAATRLLRRDGTAAQPWERLFLATCLGVFALGWLLTLKIGDSSAFWLLYQAIPGGVAIRAGGRLQLVVNLWIVSGLALAFDRWSRSALAAERSRRVMLACGLLTLCAVEQINRHHGGLSRSREQAMIDAVPPAPAHCRSFFLDRPVNPDLFHFNAMAMAAAIDLPTLNGASGLIPAGWQLEHYDAGYGAAVRRWVARRGLRDVCGYDETAGQWSAIVPLSVAID